MSVRKKVRGNPVFKHQADATLAQAGPVQNTWYTVLNTAKNVVVYTMECYIATTAEDLEFRLTIDGNVLVGAQGAAVAGTPYYWTLYAGIVASSATLYCAASRYSCLFGRSVKIEVRKTSANGAGNLNGRVTYGKVT